MIPSMLGVDKSVHLLKMLMNGKYHLMFEFINKVYFYGLRKQTGIKNKYICHESCNICGIILKHMDKVVIKMYGKHGLPYGFFFNEVFRFFKIQLGRGTIFSRKYMFIINPLREYNFKRKVVKELTWLCMILPPDKKSREQLQKCHDLDQGMPLMGIPSQKWSEMTPLTLLSTMIIIN